MSESEELNSMISSTDKNDAVKNNGQTVIRIKPVNEINSDVMVDQTENKENSYSTNTNKRKLPNWLFTPSTSKIDTSSNVTCDKNSKKPKVSDADSTELKTNGENESFDSDSNVPTSTQNTSKSDQNLDQKNESNENVKIKQEIKEEPITSNECTTTTDNVVKEEASSTTTTRDSCEYGIKCYRRNPKHRIEKAHPGDNDYKRPTFPPPPKGTPECPYGDRCYRRNPIHFQHFSHPPSTNFNKNRKARMKKLKRKDQQEGEKLTAKRKRQNITKKVDNNFDDDEDDDNEEDPFLTDSDEDYMPSDDDDYDDDDGDDNDDDD